MPDHDFVTLKGNVTDIFAHRVVLDTPTGRVLVDLTPKGAERLRLRAGDALEVTGERKPSEVKARRIVKDNGRPIDIEPKPHDRGPPHEANIDADPERALRGARSTGLTVLGHPRRKPKHFEILGRDATGDLVELHVEFDGHVRKSRRVDPNDPKWDTEIRSAQPQPGATV